MAKSKKRPRKGPTAPAPGAAKPSNKPKPEEQAARAAERARRVAEREAAQRRAAARGRRRHWLRLGAVLLVVAIVAGVIGARVIGKRRAIDRLVAASSGAARAAGCSDIEKPPLAGRKHIAPNESGSGYTSNPPASGPHFTSTAGTGVSEAAVPNERLIHNLEHGGVVIHHQGLPEAQLTELTERVRDLDDAKVLLVPNSSLPGTSAVAYTAWRRLQVCTKYDDAVLDTFLGLYLAPGGKDVGAPEKDQPL
ncbi:MAG TPA: DUF3105 domain-containing protein [Mycobacteriales bacterium]|nr:DUF3105 domain-containing protein [Mycobacteriales bacterium]